MKVKIDLKTCETLEIGLFIGLSFLTPKLKCSRSPQAAAEFWLSLGVDGIKVSDVNVAASSLDWSKLEAVFQDNGTEDTKKR